MTVAQHTAVIYGDSILLRGMADILRSLGVEVVEKQPWDTLFSETQPKVVLLDAAQISFPQLDELIQSFTGGQSTTFIRLNAEQQHLTIHSAQCLPASDITDLTQALEKIFNPIS